MNSLEEELDYKLRFVRNGSTFEKKCNLIEEFGLTLKDCEKLKYVMYKSASKIDNPFLELEILKHRYKYKFLHTDATIINYGIRTKNYGYVRYILKNTYISVNVLSCILSESDSDMKKIILNNISYNNYCKIIYPDLYKWSSIFLKLLVVLIMLFCVFILPFLI